MKRIVSLVIALIMLQTTALANATEGFAKLWKDYSDLKSFKGSTVMSATVNEPLLILDDIPLDDEGIDYPLMINDLISSTATADYSVNISEDYKKMQMAMSVAYDVPISINEDFKLETWTRMGMWLDFDITNPDAPVYKLIMKLPIESKYLVFDMTAEYEGDITEIINPDIISEMSDVMIEVIKKNGEITRTKNGYRVKFDNDGVIGYIADVFEVAKKLVPDEADIYDEIITAVESMKGKLSILGEDGLILDFTTNARGDITAYIEAIHFDFNLCDIATLLDIDTDGLVREHADINITFKAETQISGHNTTAVDIPELTEENSVDMDGAYEPVHEDYEVYEDQYIYEYVHSDQLPYIEDGELFLPVYDLFEVMFAGDFEITVDSLRYTATGDNIYDIEQIFVKVGENSIIVDDEVISFEKPVVNEFDVFRVPMEFVNKLGLELEYAWMYNDGSTYDLSMPNPNYIAE